MQRILILLFFVWPSVGSSQINANFFYDGVLKEKRTFEDTLSLKNSITIKKLHWVNQGYFFCGLDSIISQKNKILVFLHQGEKHKVNIRDLKEKNFVSQINKKLQSLNNSGYPFASIILDSISYNKGILSGIITTLKGPEVRHDSAFFFQEIKTKHKYIYRLLDIVPEEVFDESGYSLLEKKVKRSPFLALRRSTDVSFSKDKAKIYLDLEEKSTNTFEGVVGLQQKENGATSLIGGLNLSIQNLFKSGHEFDFHWKSFAEASQQLNLFYKHAFLFDAKISPSFRFSLLKQDSTFLTRTAAIGLNTYISPQISLLVEYEGTNGSLISSDIKEIENRGLADYRQYFYRIALSSGFFTLLNEYEKGTAWNISVGAGVKDIVGNVGLPDSFYDTVKLKTNFVRVDAQIAYQLKMGNRQSIFHDIHLGLLNNREILTNELYRIGGLNTLRGFNEKNFFAQYYSLSRMEIRSFFENKSFVYVFYDQLIFSRSQSIKAPFGIGCGIALETLAGQFGFALASGKSDHQIIAFSELRIHFGYISRF
ncbi:MAG: hypothetical protein AAGC64_01865 [Bacteroidota bacterium]